MRVSGTALNNRLAKLLSLPLKYAKITSPNPVRRYLSARLGTDLERSARDPEPMVRVAVLRHPSLTWELLSILKHDPLPAIAEAASAALVNGDFL